MTKNAFFRVDLVFFGLICAATAWSGWSYANDQYNDRYVVLRQPGRGELDLARATREITAAGGRVERALRYHDGVVAELSPQALTLLGSRLGPGIRIERDYPAMIPEGEAPEKSQASPSIPWGVATVRAPQANAFTKGSGVLVCVVDTGIQPDHPDLARNVAGGEGFVSDDAGAWGDDCGHGTHVAGVIAAIGSGSGVVGVAPEARLFSAKVLDAGGNGSSSTIAEGIRSCIEHHAQVINLSLVVTENSPLIHDAVADAQKRGAIVVAAAGNSGGPVMYPAKYPEVIAVSAVDSNLGLAPFSSWGAEIAFAAPGTRILSTMLYSGYALESGTSMAAPHVSGIAALMISAGRDRFGTRDAGLDSEKQGAGLIDALGSVK